MCFPQLGLDCLFVDGILESFARRVFCCLTCAAHCNDGGLRRSMEDNNILRC